MTGAARGTGLSARGITVAFEGLLALDNIDFELRPGEILGLIGPNGAGKTTLVNVLSGFQAPTHGQILLDGTDVTAWSASRRAAVGLARTFQAARLFPDMTVGENIEVPAVATGMSRAAAKDQATEFLELMGIPHRGGARANSLSYGEERLVGIARALALRPNYLMLDEPAAGLSPNEAHDLLERIGSIRDRFGCGILLIDHNMKVIMGVCDRVDVLAQGRALATGTPAEIQADLRLRQAYLGTGADAGAGVRRSARTKHIAATPLLEATDLSVNYGRVEAVSKLTLTVGHGELIAVIGPNGAGKSTLLAAIAGLVKLRTGRLAYDGNPIESLAVEDRVRRGIALVPEGRRIFSNLTVAENLRIGAHLLQSDPRTTERRENVLMSFPKLRERYHGYAGRLSGGEQQQLAIARALLSGPRLLLLDEPSLGLAPLVIDEVYETLELLNADGLSILLVEQNAHRALRVSDRAYVLRGGRVVLADTSAALQDNPEFDRAYFGFDEPVRSTADAAV